MNGVGRTYHQDELVVFISTTGAELKVDDPHG
jgi:hypothetical protein